MKIKEYLVKVKDEIKERHFWKGVRCEFLGTLLYVLFGCAAIVAWNPDNHDPNKIIRVSFSFGFIEFLLVSSLSHVSGAQFNPVITISMLCTKYITLFRATCYIFVQLIAGIISYAILYGLVPEYSRKHLAVNTIHQDISHGQAFGIEFLGTFVFVFSYFSSLRKKNEKLRPKALPCGFAIASAHLFAIFWIGPILGGIIGAFTFEYTRDCSIQLRDPQNEASNQFVYSLQNKDDVASSFSLNSEVPGEQNEIIDEL
ncbi:lens fiber major intrinsic protein-like isoform X2 [Ostrea edulis]|uniref:lens fiber major intrinsic protein-like isoform X2 n=1 Tax=Ostrea edulis TaxID=37623 RepID=UPI002095294C|nr:lens fiber major intrinsic protein-like isoform X2 [Ostrea edulis]